ncbi:hypothetical protein [Paenibacillus sp. BR2-3]|uniref:hypothetical protein n=1 Tax=Paenibacillus sp. BR2-3 TaxID=3048494 RepID=UPI003977D33A
MLRGMEKVTLEVGWLSLAHNLLKLAVADSKRKGFFRMQKGSLCRRNSLMEQPPVSRENIRKKYGVKLIISCIFKKGPDPFRKRKKIRSLYS